MDREGNNCGQPESNYPADTFWCLYFEQYINNTAIPLHCQISLLAASYCIPKRQQNS